MTVFNLVAAQFWDNNGKFVASGSVPNDFHMTNGHARVVCRTSPLFDGTFTLTGVTTNANFQFDNAFDIFVDGVYHQVVPFNVNKLGVKQTVAVRGLPTGQHTIEVWCSSVTGFGGLGSYPTQLVFDGVVLNATRPNRRLVFYTDSEGQGLLCGVPQGSLQGRGAMAWSMRFRNGGSRFDGVTTLGFSGQAAFSVMQTAPEIVNWVAEMVTAFDGLVENVAVIGLGVNDYVNSLWSAAAFQSGVTNALTALKAALPAATPIHMLTLFNVAASGNNAFGPGNAAADYATAAQAGAAAAGCLSINTRGAGWSTVADLSTWGGDTTLHPGNTGHLSNYNSLLPLI